MRADEVTWANVRFKKKSPSLPKGTRFEAASDNGLIVAFSFEEKSVHGRNSAHDFFSKGVLLARLGELNRFHLVAIIEDLAPISSVDFLEKLEKQKIFE